MANAKNSQGGPVFGHRENKGACRPAASIQKSTTVCPTHSSAKPAARVKACPICSTRFRENTPSPKNRVGSWTKAHSPASAWLFCPCPLVTANATALNSRSTSSRCSPRHLSAPFALSWVMSLICGDPV